MDEIQEKYEIIGTKYTPPYYAEAGMIVTLGVKRERKRRKCPTCGRSPLIHGYKKNGKIRNNEWSSDNNRNGS